MKKLYAFFLLALLVAGFVSASVGPARALGVRLVLIVAKGSKVTDLSKNELKRLYMSDPVVVAGIKLVPFNYTPGTPERTGFDRAVLGLSPDQVGRLWIDRRVRGQLAAPRAMPSTVYMIKVVEVFPNAIGYAPENKLSGLVQPVRIDGVSFRDPGYGINAE
jgi:ABC-type amino acid transport substrate-binding protein